MFEQPCDCYSLTNLVDVSEFYICFLTCSLCSEVRKAQQASLSLLGRLRQREVMGLYQNLWHFWVGSDFKVGTYLLSTRTRGRAHTLTRSHAPPPPPQPPEEIGSRKPHDLPEVLVPLSRNWHPHLCSSCLNPFVKHLLTFSAYSGWFVVVTFLSVGRECSGFRTWISSVYNYFSQA